MITIEELDADIQFISNFMNEFEDHPMQEPYDGYEENIINALKYTKAMRNLMKDISDGKSKVVPCEATDEMHHRMRQDYSTKNVANERIYKAAIAAAPDLMAEYWRKE